MEDITERIAMDIARNQIMKHEGFRNKIYKDSVGVLTIGYGHALLEGSSLPTYILDLIFDDVDFPTARIEAEELMDEYQIPNPGLPRKVVLIDMAFNLGKTKLRKFKTMWAALKAQDYEAAADAMVHSKWYRQVGRRSERLVRAMRRGEYLT